MKGGGKKQIVQKGYSKAEAQAGLGQQVERSYTVKWYGVPDFSIAKIRRTSFLAA